MQHLATIVVAVVRVVGVVVVLSSAAGVVVVVVVRICPQARPVTRTIILWQWSDGPHLLRRKLTLATWLLAERCRQTGYRADGCVASIL